MGGITGDELLERLSKRAQARYGHLPSDRGRPVNIHRIVRRWCDEHVIPGPDPLGRTKNRFQDWRWSCASYRAALQVWRLRCLGADYYLIRIEQWLRNGSVAFVDFHKSLVSQFGHFQRRFERKTTSKYHPADRAAPSDRTKLLIARAMTCRPGERVDASPFSTDSIVALYGIVRFAVGNLGPIINEARVRSPTLNTLSDMLPGLQEFLEQGFKGLLGDSDEAEHTSEKVIARGDQLLFRDARDFANTLPWLSALTPYLLDLLIPEAPTELNVVHELGKSLSAGLMHGYPRMYAFIVIARLMHTDSDWRTFAVWCSAKSVPALQELVAFVRNDSEARKLFASDNPLAFLPLLLPSGFIKHKIPAENGPRARQLLWNHGLQRFLLAMKDSPPWWPSGTPKSARK